MEPNSSTITLAESDTPIEQKTTNHKKLFFWAGIVTICIVGFVVASGFLGDQVTGSQEVLDAIKSELRMAQEAIEGSHQKEPTICMTKECVTSAAFLLESMDPTVDPCQDFYQFACGGWIKKNSLPEGQARWGQFEILREKVVDTLREILKEPIQVEDSKPLNTAREMYAACMDAEAIEALGLDPLKNLLASYGQWPMTFSHWSEEHFDWKRIAASIRTLLGDTYLFELYNSPDYYNNTEINTIYLDQASIGLPYTTLINTSSNSTAIIMQEYAVYMSKAAKILRDSINGGTDDSAIKHDVEQVVQFQISLAKIYIPAERRRNKTRMYNPMTLSALQNWTDHLNLTNHGRIDWIEFINEIYSTVGITVSHDEHLIVREPNQLKNLLMLLDRTPKRVIANYMLWRLVLRTSGDTTQEMNFASSKFWKVFYGTTGSQPRWKGCVNRVSGYLGFAVGAAYIERSFDQQAKNEMTEMIGHVKAAFGSLVEEADWMDGDTKRRALHKAKAMKEFIAYPEWIFNNTKLEELYHGIEASPDRHFDNIVNVTRFYVETMLKELRNAIDRTKWTTPPIIVNAFYHSFNSITFPAGILQAPFFRKGHLAAMNYGSIGSVIGHEITHGFDDQGRQTDENGRVDSWWTNQTVAKYLSGAQCFIEQYGNYTYPEFNGTKAQHINGIISQGENIADNSGIREAFRAYQNYISTRGREPSLPGLERYTAEQIFFISYANIWCSKMTSESRKQQILNGPHSPEPERVRGPLSNSQDFAHHFQCPVGPMNRAKKCVLW